MRSEIGDFMFETCIVLALIGLCIWVLFLNFSVKQPKVVEIKEIESIIKAGSFIYDDKKYSIKMTDEKVWKSNLKESV